MEGTADEMEEEEDVAAAAAADNVEGTVEKAEGRDDEACPVARARAFLADCFQYDVSMRDNKELDPVGLGGSCGMPREMLVVVVFG